MRCAVFALLLLSLCAGALAYPRFVEGYADGEWNNLTGWSSTQDVKVGIQHGDAEQGPLDQGYVTLLNEWYDTGGTRLQTSQSSTQGTTVALGYRHWFPGKEFYGSVTAGESVLGPNAGHIDFRAGFAGYNAWEQVKGESEQTTKARYPHYTDLYGEIFYLSLAKDTFATARYRPGFILLQDKDELSGEENGRLWLYGVGQLWASGTGTNGADNRLEAGIGIGYVFHAHLDLNFDLREGDVFRGTTPERTYFNPTVVVAGNF